MCIILETSPHRCPFCMCECLGQAGLFNYCLSYMVLSQAHDQCTQVSVKGLFPAKENLGLISYVVRDQGFLEVGWHLLGETIILSALRTMEYSCQRWYRKGPNITSRTSLGREWERHARCISRKLHCLGVGACLGWEYFLDFYIMTCCNIFNH